MKIFQGSHKQAWVITIFVCIAILVCLICNFAIQREMTWLVYPVCSLVFAWGVFFPLILKGNSGLKLSLVLLTTLILPYLLVLERWVGGQWFIPIAFPIVIGCIAFVWSLYLISCYLRNPWKKSGLASIVAGILSLGVYFLLSVLNSFSMFPWGWITFGSAFGLGALLFLAGFIRGHATQ